MHRKNSNAFFLFNTYLRSGSKKQGDFGENFSGMMRLMRRNIPYLKTMNIEHSLPATIDLVTYLANRNVNIFTTYVPSRNTCFR